ncbi:hypothetical protein IWQ60_000682 [Tieghemiomyces parasiticus]|uniref:Protein kinase domain-containing protein n=1 Tax=Tieghemiomyces parasiticus TaxID=78921 RepID=A0A9W8A3J8_9FUNG|nr:hypothetical protein IWQ60_007403 [Tieghemiomyces parasiticus]KAJ1930018.1 hypothetical protein IWQ60_000682 [Tieghemiomyces parasiticus]
MQRSVSISMPTRDTARPDAAGCGGCLTESSAEPPEAIPHPRRVRRRLSIASREQNCVWKHLYGAIMASANEAQRGREEDLYKYRAISHISGKDYAQLARSNLSRPRHTSDSSTDELSHWSGEEGFDTTDQASAAGDMSDATTAAGNEEDEDEDVYMAPCEHHPAKRYRRYLINDRMPKISTELSKVEFGIRSQDFTPLAFKTVPDRMLGDREYHILDQLKALPHVLHLVDSFVDDSGRRVLVLPVVKKMQVFHRDLQDIQRILRQLVVALAGVHHQHITHLDVNPANIMSDGDDNLVLIDFGLASECGPGHALPACGTPGFVAPEVLSGEASDPRADMYSLGIVMGMMLEDYFPTVDLQYLGGSMVRASTTDEIVAQLDDILALRPERQAGSYYSPSGLTPWDYTSSTLSTGQSVSTLSLSSDTGSVCSSNGGCGGSGRHVPTVIYDAADLLRSLLLADPSQRPDSEAALQHPFLTAPPADFVGTDYETFSKRWGSYFADQLRARTPPTEPYDAYLGNEYLDNYVIYY